MIYYTHAIHIHNSQLASSLSGCEYYSRVKLLDDPEKIARKRFMAFLSSLGSIVKHTKSRHHSDHQKVFKLYFKKRWPPIKKDSLYICISVDSNSLRPVYMLQLFIFINIFINIFIQLQFVILLKVYDYIENKILT